MTEDNKDNINVKADNDSASDKTDNIQSDNFQSEGDKSVNHEVIHKKDGRLHIYVRQDKYKGELKSKNWVGRAYINGKQTIFSSRTTSLQEAIPILEKWYDELSIKNQKPSTEEDSKNENNDNLELKTQNEQLKNNSNEENQLQLAKNDNTGLKSSMFDKLKNIKINNLLKSKETNSSTEEGSENNNSSSSSTVAPIYVDNSSAPAGVGAGT